MHAEVIIIFPSPTHAKQGIIRRVYGNDAKCILNTCFSQVAALTSSPNKLYSIIDTSVRNSTVFKCYTIIDRRAIGIREVVYQAVFTRSFLWDNSQGRNPELRERRTVKWTRKPEPPAPSPVSGQPHVSSAAQITN